MFIVNIVKRKMQGSDDLMVPENQWVRRYSGQKLGRQNPEILPLCCFYDWWTIPQPESGQKLLWIIVPASVLPFLLIPWWNGDAASRFLPRWRMFLFLKPGYSHWSAFSNFLVSYPSYWDLGFAAGQSSYYGTKRICLISCLSPGGIGHLIYCDSKVHGNECEKIHNLWYVQNEDVKS